MLQVSGRDGRAAGAAGVRGEGRRSSEGKGWKGVPRIKLLVGRHEGKTGESGKDRGAFA